MSYVRIKRIVDLVEGLGLKPQIQKTREFFDEPRFYYYSTLFKLSRKFTDWIIDKEMAAGSGHSLISAEEALLKSLYEEMERFSLYCYKNKEISFKSYNDSPEKILDPSAFSKDKKIKKMKIGWIKGKELTTGGHSLLP